MTRRERNCRRKKPFRLKVHAETFILHLLNNPNRKHRVNHALYSYQCDICGLYHITSRESYVTAEGIRFHDAP